MFDHRRSVWLPAGEKFNGPSLNAARIDSIVIHYIGTARAPSNSAQWMLNEHRRSMGRDPGYAFMYNSHVALDGQTWEGRGLEFRNAANGSATNPTTWSIVFAVDGQNGASEAQIAGARKLVRGFCNFLGRKVPLVAHRVIGQTQCPGEGIVAQIESGMFERNPNVTRVSGSNRYETAVMVSQMAYPKGAPVAYVVSGEDWPDAISAGSFTDGPTLFVTANGIPRATRNEIKRLKVKRVVVVGGEMVVSNAVLAELEMLIL
jgi:hypothetical protein